MSLLEHFPSIVTPGASRDIPGALAQSCHSGRQSCHSWSTCRRISKFQRRIVFAQTCHAGRQSCYSWSSRRRNLGRAALSTSRVTYSIEGSLRGRVVLFLVRKLSPSGVLLAIFAFWGKKKLFLIAKRKKFCQITHIVHYFICNIYCSL